MQPLHPTALNLLAKPHDGEEGQLVLLEERDDGRDAAGGDRVQVSVEIPRPGASDRELIVLSGREGDADFPSAGPRGLRRSEADECRWS